MKRNLLTWLIYDSGNSFLQASLGGLYLAQWIVLDKGYPDIWYGGAFVISTILVLLLSPLLGAWSDGVGKRFPFIKSLTLFLYLSIAMLALLINSGFPTQVVVFAVLFFFIISQTLYQLSLVSYNALLGNLSSPQNRGKVIGLGEVFNGLGWIVATAILLPFAEGKITIFGAVGRSQVYFPALVGFVLLTIPMLLWFREESKLKKAVVDFSTAYKKTLRGIKELFTVNKNVGKFLLGFSLVSDAVLTVQLYFAIAMNEIYGISDRQKFGILVIILLSTVVGGYVLGALSDKIGKKKILISCCVLAVFVFTAGFLGNALWILYVVAVFSGIVFGGFYTTSKALMVSLSPPEKLGEYFGFYSTFQRFASIVGPLLWGGVTLALSGYPVLKYRAAGFALTILVVIGTLVLRKVEEVRAN